jgi:hypothetical protein
MECASTCACTAVEICRPFASSAPATTSQASARPAPVDRDCDTDDARSTTRKAAAASKNDLADRRGELPTAEDCAAQAASGKLPASQVASGEARCMNDDTAWQNRSSGSTPRSDTKREPASPAGDKDDGAAGPRHRRQQDVARTDEGSKMESERNSATRHPESQAEWRIHTDRRSPKARSPADLGAAEVTGSRERLEAGIDYNGAVAEADALMSMFAPPPRAGQALKQRESTRGDKRIVTMGNKEAACDDEEEVYGHDVAAVSSDFQRAQAAARDRKPDLSIPTTVSKDDADPEDTRAQVVDAPQETIADPLSTTSFDKHDQQEQSDSEITSLCRDQTNSHQATHARQAVTCQGTGSGEEAMDEFEAYLHEQKQIETNTDRLVPKPVLAQSPVGPQNKLPVEPENDGFSGVDDVFGEGCASKHASSTADQSFGGHDTGHQTDEAKDVKIMEQIVQDDGHFLSQAAREAMEARERSRKRKEERERLKSAGKERGNSSSHVEGHTLVCAAPDRAGANECQADGNSAAAAAASHVGSEVETLDQRQRREALEFQEQNRKKQQAAIRAQDFLRMRYPDQFSERELGVGRNSSIDPGGNTPNQTRGNPALIATADCLHTTPEAPCTLSYTKKDEATGTKDTAEPGDGAMLPKSHMHNNYSTDGDVSEVAAACGAGGSEQLAVADSNDRNVSHDTHDDDRTLNSHDTDRAGLAAGERARESESAIDAAVLQASPASNNTLESDGGEKSRDSETVAELKSRIAQLETLVKAVYPPAAPHGNQSACTNPMLAYGPALMASAFPATSGQDPSVPPVPFPVGLPHISPVYPPLGLVPSGANLQSSLIQAMDMATASAGTPALRQDSMQMAGFLNSLRNLIEQAQSSLVAAQTSAGSSSEAGPGEGPARNAGALGSARDAKAEDTRRKMEELQKQEEEEEREKLRQEEERQRVQEEKEREERQRRAMKRFADFVSRLRPHIARSAAVKLQKVVRGFCARKHARRLAERRDKMAQRVRTERHADADDKELMEQYADQVRTVWMRSCVCVCVCLCVCVCVCVSQTCSYEQQNTRTFAAAVYALWYIGACMLIYMMCTSTIHEYVHLPCLVRSTSSCLFR